MSSGVSWDVNPVYFSNPPFTKQQWKIWFNVHMRIPDWGYRLDSNHESWHHDMMFVVWR